MFGMQWAANPDVPEDGIPKATPPAATPIALPNTRLKAPLRVTYPKDDKRVVAYVRYLFAYTRLRNITTANLRSLNISNSAALPLDQVVNAEYIVPRSWLVDPAGPLEFVWQSKEAPRPVKLSNRNVKPDQKRFYELSSELSSSLGNVYRSLRRDPPKEGYETIKIRTHRKFWIALHAVGTYWDTSLDAPESSTVDDSVTEAQNDRSNDTTEQSAQHGPSLVTDEEPLDTSGIDLDTDDEMEIYPEISLSRVLTYTGRRTSTGSFMPEKLAIDLGEAFLEPIMFAFGCHFTNTSRRDPSPLEHRLYVGTMMTPCSNTRMIFTSPKDRAKARRGILEGPVAVLHTQAGVSFGSKSVADVIHLVRELKAMLLCAQQRSREGKQAFGPGHGEWWGRPGGRWGRRKVHSEVSKDGDAVGKPLTDLDLFPETVVVDSGASHTQEALVTRAEHLTMGQADGHSTGDESRATNTSQGRPTQNPELVTRLKSMAEQHNDMEGQEVSRLTGDQLEDKLQEETLALDISSDDDAMSLDAVEDITSPSSSTAPQSPTRKRSFQTFRDKFGEPSGKIESEADRVAASEKRLAGLKSSVTAWLDWSPNPDQTPGLFKVPTTHPEYHVLKQEWYKSKLAELRASEPLEHKMRAAGLEKASQPAKLVFTKSNNEAKRVGVAPLASHDQIYLFSVVNHHISIVSLRISTKMIDWLSPNPREHEKVADLVKDASTWWGLPVKRTRWYDLFDAQDRVEVLEGAWAVFGEMMADPESEAMDEMLEKENASNAE